MKKKFMGIALVLASALFVSNVYADEEFKGTECATLGTGVCEENWTDNSINIKLTKDLEASAQIVLDTAGVTVNIDLNGHNLIMKKEKLPSNNTFIMVKKGNLNITGEGSVKTEKGFVIGTLNNDEKSITIGEKVTIETTETDSKTNTAINIDTALKTTVDIYGTVKANGAAINVNGNQKTIADAPVINIHDGASIIGNTDLAMYLAGYANTTIGKATITGKTGIGIKSGVLNLNGTTILATGNPNEGQPVTGGMTSTGAAIQIEDNDDYKTSGSNQTVKLNINGGNYKSEHNSVLVEYGEIGEDEKPALSELAIKDAKFESGRTDVEVIVLPENTKLEKFISGGQFIGKLGDDFEDYIVDGLVVNADGTVAKPVAASTENNNPNEKDDAPETNDVFPMALVGIITLGLAGTYTYKKLHN